MLLIGFTLIHDLVPIKALFFHTLVFLVNIQAVFLIVELALNPRLPFIRIFLSGEGEGQVYGARGYLAASLLVRSLGLG